MCELQEQAEIDRLIEEQQREDKDYQAPEFPNTVPLDSVEDRLGTQAEELIFVGSNERGSVLGHQARVVNASWHGTLAGYARQKCKCRPCRDAKAAYERKRRAKRDEA
jgi:hypothetical protein